MRDYLVTFRLPTGRRDVPNRLKAQYVTADSPAAAIREIERAYPDARYIRKPEER